MKHTVWVAGACLVGGLAVLGLWSGLDAPAHATAEEAWVTGPGDVVISEIAWMGTAANSADEWIELYNTTAVTVSLDGWHLLDDDTMDLGLDGEIPPQGYYVIERTDDSAISDVEASWFGSFGVGGLGNDGEMLTLTNDMGAVVDSANADGGPWPAGTSSTGVVTYATMERMHPGDPGSDVNWCTNDGATRNGLDAAGRPINGTPGAANSCSLIPGQPAADLAVAKSGPATTTAGSLITYVVTVGNVGTAVATDTLLTDTLPSAVEFVTQTSPFSFDHSGRVLVWQLGDVPAGASRRVTVTAQVSQAAVGPLVNVGAVAGTFSEVVTANNTDAWTTTLGSARVLIEAVLYDGHQAWDRDEAVRLVNIGNAMADVAGWRLCDSDVGGSCAVLPETTLVPGQRIWLADWATSFLTSFGFLPALAIHAAPGVEALEGTWPGLANGDSEGQDEVVLRDPADDVIDTLVYEEGVTTTTGWSGAAVRPYTAARAEGQILLRVADERTGLPDEDTDTAADWIQDTASVTRGRRTAYPGWDLDPLFWPLTVTTPATVVVGIAPDNAFDVVSQTIARAQQTIDLQVYSLRHPALALALAQKAREGVSVTVLLEGGQVGVGLSDPSWQQELWACREIEIAGGQCWFMIHDTDVRVFSRYSYLHAKYLVVDGAWLLVSSQNLTVGGLPSDDRSNGTWGSRGAVVATNAHSVAERAAEVFSLDLDPIHHNDLVRWDPARTGTYGPPLITYTPELTVPDFATTTVYFADPLVANGTFGFELLTAPEAALRQSDALLGLVGRAGSGDAVYVEQLYEYVDWGDDPVSDPNLRLTAYIDAARRGARVRILLNSGDFGQPGFQSTNSVTVAYVNQIARSESLDLEAAAADPTHYGIHNKMVLVWIHDRGGYAHVGSINGSEASSKVNRELAIQVQSDAVYAYLKQMFDLDWQISQPVYLPLVTRGYVAPADYLLISEVAYWGACEWVEIANSTPFSISLAGHRLGDAQSPDRYEAMYLLPDRLLGPGEVLLVAGDAAACNLTYVPVDYELFGNHPAVPNLARVPLWGNGEFGLGNSGDEVLLVDPGGLVVDVVVYGSGHYPGVLPHPGTEPGDTLERIPASVDTDDCQRDFVGGWSPGWVNLE